MEEDLAAIELCTTFQHCQLTSPRQIRLLTFLDDSGKLIVQPNILDVSIDDAPPYIALSYTWGDQHNSRLLDVTNDTTMSISKSLSKALQQLQVTFSPRYIWIDQICIDQGNIPEKNQQVTLMGEIYSRAKEVVVWLGNDNVEFSRIQAMLDCIDAEPAGIHICQPPHAIGPYDDLADQPFSWICPSASLGSCGRTEMVMFHPYQRAISSLLSKTWFTRAWVFQEAVLAKKVTFLLESTTFSFEELDRLVGVFARLEFRFGSGQTTMRSRGFRPFNKMAHGRKNMTTSNPAMCLMYMLTFNAGWFDLSNPRDRIYAFLGLPYTQKLNIEVDYALTVEEIFINTTLAFIKEDGCLEILGCCHDYSPSEKGYMPFRPSLDLPSWVPHYDRPLSPIYSTLYARDDLKGFYSSKKRRHCFQETSTTSLLSIRGKIIDTIEYYVPPKRTAKVWDDPLENLIDWIRLQEHVDWLMQAVRSFYQNAGNITRERVLNVLLAGGAYITDETRSDDEDRRAPFLEKSRLRAVLKAHDMWEENFEKTGGALPTGDFSQLYESSKALSSRMFIVGRSGSFGLSPEIATLDDKICIIHGSAVPLILRSFCREGHTLYKFIGECYFEDVMFGEAVTWEEDSADIFLLA